MKKIYCDICRLDITTVETGIFGLELSASHAQEAPSVEHIDLCINCHNNVVQKAKFWIKSGNVL